MIWDKPITADGYTASPEQMQKAWSLWMETDRCWELTACELAMRLERAGVPHSARHPDPFKSYGLPSSRLAGAMLQRARRANAIRYVKGRWEIIEGEGK